MSPVVRPSLVLALLAALLPGQEPATDVNRVPMLPDVPLLGHLFKARQEERAFLRLGEGWAVNRDEEAAGVPRPADAGERFLLDMLRVQHGEALRIELVEKSIARSADGTSFTVDRERGLEVRGPAEEVRKAEALHKKWLAANQRMIRAEIRILDIGDETRTDGDPQVVIVNRAALDARIEVLRGKGAGTIVTSPTVQTFSGQRASVQVVNQISYVKDFEIQVVQGAAIADPVIDVIQEGIVLETSFLAEPDGRVLRGSAEVKLSAVVRPIREVTTKLALGGSAVTFQKPEVHTSGWKGDDLRIDLGRGEEGFRIAGLVMPCGEKGKKDTNVEIWCILALVDPEPDSAAHGEVAGMDDKYGNAFVHWPVARVPDDPAEQAPKKATFWRDGNQVAEGELTGGWNLGELAPDAKQRLIAIYRITSGTARTGDEAR